MAEYDNRALRGRTGTATAGVIDQGLRTYMLRVYNYMLVGLAITGLVAYAVSILTTTADPALAATPMHHGMALTSLGVTLFLTPLRWLVVLAPLGMVLFMSFRMSHLSAGGAQAAFWIFSALMGVSLSTIFFVYTGNAIFQVFFITAAAFGGLSLWGYTTKTDLSGFGSFLIMGLWGLIIASLVNMFLQSPMTMWVISVIGVLIFAGLTAYDTQKIKEMYTVGDDGTLTSKKAIMGALALYLDFINMFLFMLRLFGDRR